MFLPYTEEMGFKDKIEITVIRDLSDKDKLDIVELVVNPDDISPP